MTHPFDGLTFEELKQRPLLKWRHYDDDVLAMWVADMDFPVADGVRQGIHAWADSTLYGYPEWTGLPGVREALVRHLERTTGWQIAPEQVWLLPGVVPGLFGAVKAFSSQGDGILANTPLYPPFRMATEQQGRVFQPVDLTQDTSGRYAFNPDAAEAAVTPATRLFMLCHPHNPTGRSFERQELEAMADLVTRHRLFAVSDELHADLTFDGRHTPFATVNAEAAARTVTLVGPTKAFNLAGLKIGFAVAENPEVLDRFKEAMAFVSMPPPSPSQAGARAAYDEGGEWFASTLAYLKGNRDLIDGFVRDRLPGVRFHAPQATYLAWLDFRDTALAEDPAGMLLEHGRLGLNDGASFGPAGRGFARLNFATARPIVQEALERIEGVLQSR